MKDASYPVSLRHALELLPGEGRPADVDGAGRNLAPDQSVMDRKKSTQLSTLMHSEYYVLQ